MTRLSIRALLVILFVSALAVSRPPAFAQSKLPAAMAAPAGETVAPVDPAVRLDDAKQKLDQIEARLNGDSMTDADLVKLRASLDPISNQIQGVAADVQPRLAGLKARLEQLGPPPDPKANPPAAPEDPVVTQERADQQKLAAAADDLVKRANVSQLRADQIAAQIADRRRTLFSNSVFQTSSSILAPGLWMDVARDTPHNLIAARNALMDFFGQLVSAFSGATLLLFLTSLVAVVAAIVAAVLLASRVAPRRKTGPAPSDLQKAMSALWVALSIMVVPFAAIMAIYALTNWFGFSAEQFKPLSDAFFRGVVRFSWAYGLGNAIFAPRRPLWRPIDLSDRVAQRLMNLVLIVAGLISLGDLVEGLDEVIGASLPVSVAAKGAFSLLVGVALIRGLYGIVAAPDDDEASTGRPANLVDEGPWWPAIRFTGWAATLAVIASDLVGYVALSSFLVRQIAWTAFVAGFLFLSQKAVSESLEHAFRPTTRFGRALLASLGLRRESLAQIGVLLSGAVILTLYAVAGLLILVPWGLQSHDMVGAFQSAFFGFKIGDVTVSPWGVLTALALFVMGYTVTHTIQNWLEKSYLPLTQIDQGLQASIRTSVGYIGVILSLLFSVAYLGLNLEKLALVVSALSVGIGLGLQGVVNNFVSGLILLWERAIRVGDLVVIGEDQGYVRRINVRATEIETADRATMIVPNGNLMTGVVKNYVRGDRIGRIRIPVQVVAGSDPGQVREVLIDAAKSHEEIVGIPAPVVLFSDFNANQLNFELICFVENVERAGRVKSDLLFAVFKHFNEAGLKMASPGTTLDLDLEKFAPLLDRYFQEHAAKSAASSD